MKSAIFARLVLVSTVLGGMLSANAMAFPRNQVRGKVAFGFQPNVHNFELLDIDFTAIVALSDCSGSLVRFTNSAPTDKAMVLTNGHCHEGSFIQPDDAVSQVRSARRFQLLNSTATATLGTLTATQVIYGTMTGTDMLLYKLDTSYEAIEKKYGVNALTISESRSEAGAPIRIASGYWKRMYSCKIDDFVHKLREDKWTFNDSIRYTQPGCKTIGGTSGSPIVHADSNEVVGVNNTGNDSGQRCTMNNPCEVDESDKVTVRKGASYGQEIYQIYDCLNAKNEVDLTQPGCTLTKPKKNLRR